jgi:hypothetical protein
MNNKMDKHLPGGCVMLGMLFIMFGCWLSTLIFILPSMAIMVGG